MVKKTDTEGIVFKIKRFSVHDGPGIRTSVFLKGCPLNCIWCHSPEGISSAISLWQNQSLCIACNNCVRSCPENALKSEPDPVTAIQIDRNKCKLSGNCVEVCPTGAISYTGFKSTVSEILIEIEKDFLYYQTSGGGVTLTGGEPLYQPEFSENILREIRNMNIHSAIETSLFCEREVIKVMAEMTDLFIVDMKLYDTTEHIRYTGKSNEIIKENFRFLAGQGKPLVVRIPMIPNITDSDRNTKSIIRFVHNIDKNIPVELIGFNPLAENNYKRLNIPYLLK